MYTERSDCIDTFFMFAKTRKYTLDINFSHE